jgi:RNA methyltransferase, TrmH family
MPIRTDELKKLHQKKYRSEFGYFLAEGEHLVLELEKAAQQNKALLESEVYVTELWQDWPSVFNKHLITERQMAAATDTKTPQGIIALVPFRALMKPSSSHLNTQPDQCTRAIYLHEIQDPGNLGTVLRTLAWFGNFRCLLSPGCVDPFNPKVVRASMGAVFHVPLELDVPIMTLRERFSSVACLTMQGSPLSEPRFKQFDCYVFGNEARGIPHEHLRELQAQAFTIPGCGAIESLNLAAAVNICIYEVTRASN